MGWDAGGTDAGRGEAIGVGAAGGGAEGGGVGDGAEAVEGSTGVVAVEVEVVVLLPVVALEDSAGYR